MPLHRLTTLTLGVPDPGAAEAFYTEFGLTPRGDGVLATRDGGDQLRLVPRERRGLVSLGVGVDDPDDLDAAAARLAALDPALPCERTADALHTADPVTGTQVVIEVAPRIVDTSSEPAVVNRPGHRDRRGEPSAVIRRHAPVQPSKLSHVVLGSPDYEATTRFFVDGVGFRVSDAIDGLGSFMRCSTSHHNLLVQNADRTFVHHTAWEVDDVDEVGRGAAAMLDGHPERHVWGLGRHAIGSNYFWYLRDPSGTFAEYTSDVDEIDGDDYRPEAWAGTQVLYAWAPPVPMEFLAPTDLGSPG